MTRTMMTSMIAMTAAERAAGRYMRAPDHPTGGEGGDGGGGEQQQPPAEAEPIGEEINDPIEDTGSHRQPAGEDDSLSDDGAGGEEGGEPKSPEPKPDDTAERLTALERQLAEEQRDREYWQGRANGTINEDGTPVDQPQDDTIPPDDPDRPDPSKYKYGETDADYIRDLARYETNLAFEERQAQEQVKSQLAEVETAHSERVGKARERYQDYDDLVVKGADPDPATGQPKWACSPLMTLGIKTSEFGPDIAYHLASNPEESLRIAKLSPLEQAKEFGRLEYRAEMEVKGNQSATTQRVSGAPEPPPRVRGGSGKTEIPADTDDFSAFEQRADSHLKTAKRR